MQIGEIGVHEFVGERGVGAPPCFGELETGLDEQRARGEHPELFGAAPIVRDEGLRCGMEFGTRGAIVEHAPCGATRVERVENDVAFGIVEGFDKGPGKIENDRTFAPFTDLPGKLG